MEKHNRCTTFLSLGDADKYIEVNKRRVGEIQAISYIVAEDGTVAGSIVLSQCDLTGTDIFDVRIKDTHSNHSILECSVNNDRWPCKELAFIFSATEEITTIKGG